MVNDKFGNCIYQTNDIIDILYKNKDYVKDILVMPGEDVDKFENHSGLILNKYNPDIENISIEEFDRICQEDWFVPDNYKNFDLESFLLDKCAIEQEKQRVEEELTAYKEKNMIMLLKTLKYLVDTMRENNIIWGVGRGSSVSSYVLYLIGVHKVNSIKYDLDWREFLR